MLYEVESVRRFVGLSAWAAAGRDDDSELPPTCHELGAGLFEEINRYLESKGLRLQEGISGREHHSGALIGEESG